MKIEDIPWMLVMVASGLAALALTAGALIAWRGGRRRRAGSLAVGLAGLVVFYVVTLVGVSLASRRHVLAPGEIKRFCGVYLDCHIGVSVDQVSTTATVGDPGRLVRAQGTFHIVTLRVSSDARRATLTPYGLRAFLVDERGRRFERHRGAERALAGDRADRPLEESVAAGDSYTRTLVFDLPADATRPVLSVTEQALPDVALEWFLIGDEDSLLHQPTLLNLAPANLVGTRIGAPSR